MKHIKCPKPQIDLVKRAIKEHASSYLSRVFDTAEPTSLFTQEIAAFYHNHRHVDFSEVLINFCSQAKQRNPFTFTRGFEPWVLAILPKDDQLEDAPALLLHMLDTAIDCIVDPKTKRIRQDVYDCIGLDLKIFVSEFDEPEAIKMLTTALVNLFSAELICPVFFPKGEDNFLCALLQKMLCLVCGLNNEEFFQAKYHYDDICLTLSESYPALSPVIVLIEDKCAQLSLYGLKYLYHGVHDALIDERSPLRLLCHERGAYSWFTMSGVGRTRTWQGILAQIQMAIVKQLELSARQRNSNLIAVDLELLDIINQSHSRSRLFAAEIPAQIRFKHLFDAIADSDILYRLSSQAIAAPAMRI